MRDALRLAHNASRRRPRPHLRDLLPEAAVALVLVPGRPGGVLAAAGARLAHAGVVVGLGRQGPARAAAAAADAAGRAEAAGEALRRVVRPARRPVVLLRGLGRQGGASPAHMARGLARKGLTTCYGRRLRAQRVGAHFDRSDAACGAVGARARACKRPAHPAGRRPSPLLTRASRPGSSRLRLAMPWMLRGAEAERSGREPWKAEAWAQLAGEPQLDPYESLALLFPLQELPALMGGQPGCRKGCGRPGGASPPGPSPGVQ